MVVDNLVRTWLEMTAKYQKVVQEGLVIKVGIFLGVFYSVDGMVGLRYSEWIQNSLNILISLLWWYRIVANVAKSWTITYQTGSLWSGI